MNNTVQFSNSYSSTSLHLAYSGVSYLTTVLSRGDRDGIGELYQDNAIFIEL